jgi:hypothetical protein
MLDTNKIVNKIIYRDNYSKNAEQTGGIIRPESNPQNVSYSDFAKGTEAYKSQRQKEYEDAFNRAETVSSNLKRGSLESGTRDYVTRNLASQYNKEMADVVSSQKQGLSNINTQEYKQALSDKPQLINYLNNTQEYNTALSSWVNKYKDVLSRSENYDEANRLLNPLQAELKTDEQTQYKEYQDVFSKFGTYSGLGDRLVSKAPDSYNVSYAKGFGFVKAPYLQGEYEELDPNTMIVTKKQAEVTGYQTVTRGDNQFEIPQISEKIIGTYKVGSGSALLRERAIYENIGRLSNVPGMNEGLAQSQKISLPARQPTNYINVINPYTGRIQSGRNDYLLPKEQVQGMVIQDLIKSKTPFDINTQTGKIDYQGGSYNFSPRAAQQVVYGPNLALFSNKAMQSITKNQPSFKFTGEGFQIPPQTSFSEKVITPYPKSTKVIRKNYDDRIALITGIGRM